MPASHHSLKWLDGVSDALAYGLRLPETTRPRFALHGAQRLRPVLVLTPANSHGDFIGAQFTSRLRHVPQVRLADSDFELGELPSASILRPNKAFTLTKDLVLRRVWRLNGLSFSHALGVICKYLGCPCSDPSDTGGQ